MLTKLVNGIEVIISPEEEARIRAEWASEDTKKQAEQEAYALIKYKDDRAAEYPPIGDQLDAILKQLNFDRLNGRTLIQDMDDILGQWLAVKDKYPKP